MTLILLLMVTVSFALNGLIILILMLLEIVQVGSLEEKIEGTIAYIPLLSHYSAPEQQAIASDSQAGHCWYRVHTLLLSFPIMHWSHTIQTNILCMVELSAFSSSSDVNNVLFLLNSIWFPVLDQLLWSKVTTCFLILWSICFRH